MIADDEDNDEGDGDYESIIEEQRRGSVNNTSAQESENLIISNFFYDSGKYNHYNNVISFV